MRSGGWPDRILFFGGNELRHGFSRINTDLKRWFRIDVRFLFPYTLTYATRLDNSPFVTQLGSRDYLDLSRVFRRHHSHSQGVRE
jgi:hypothetical protein